MIEALRQEAEKAFYSQMSFRDADKNSFVNGYMKAKSFESQINTPGPLVSDECICVHLEVENSKLMVSVSKHVGDFELTEFKHPNQFLLNIKPSDEFLNKKLEAQHSQIGVAAIEDAVVYVTGRFQDYIDTGNESFHVRKVIECFDGYAKKLTPPAEGPFKGRM